MIYTSIPYGFYKSTRIYIYGGSGIGELKDCDEYKSDNWISRADMPNPARQFLAASTIKK